VVKRWLRFNIVGAAGIGVQVAVLVLLASALRVDYLAATALAVEAAVVHNFAWHERWTWTGCGKRGTLLFRFLTFNVSNGALSLAGNLVLMRLLVGALHLHYAVANLVAIAVCSLANFLASEWLLLTPVRPAPRTTRRKTQILSRRRRLCSRFSFRALRHRPRADPRAGPDPGRAALRYR